MKKSLQTIAERTDERIASAEKLVLTLEALGCVFAPDDKHGWTITGPKCAYHKYDEALTEYATEIAAALNNRCKYIADLIVIDVPKPSLAKELH